MAEPTAKTIQLTIDGQPCQAPAGANLVEVARAQKIFIPSLCYYPHIEPPLGTCRVCTCRIDGQYRPACTEQVREGMEVEVHTAELDDMRQALVEMMFAEGNHFCPACPKSGDCDLQHMGYELGISHSRFPHLFKDRVIDFKPKRLVVEHNLCIKCGRCVREVLTDDGQRVFSACHRGNETLIGVDYELEARLNERQAMEAMRLCPTGAILVRGESQTRPFGDRRFDLESFNPQRREPTGQRVATPREKKIVATVSLAGCFGCHMSLLDVDLGFIDLIEVLEFNRSPLNDIKRFTQHCDIGLIEGGCCNSENVETLREFRRHCDLLVSVGECAIWGGLPAMRNTIPLRECLEEAYLHGMASEPEESVVPYHEDLPRILDKVYACHEVVEIDYHIPGCPPSAEHIWKALGNLLWGEHYSVLYSEFKYD